MNSSEHRQQIKCAHCGAHPDDLPPGGYVCCVPTVPDYFELGERPAELDIVDGFRRLYAEAFKGYRIYYRESWTWLQIDTPAWQLEFYPIWFSRGAKPDPGGFFDPDGPFQKWWYWKPAHNGCQYYLVVAGFLIEWFFQRE